MRGGLPRGRPRSAPGPVPSPRPLQGSWGVAGYLQESNTHMRVPLTGSYFRVRVRVHMADNTFPAAGSPSARQ